MAGYIVLVPYCLRSLIQLESSCKFLCKHVKSAVDRVRNSIILLVSPVAMSAKGNFANFLMKDQQVTVHSQSESVKNQKNLPLSKYLHIFCVHGLTISVVPSRESKSEDILEEFVDEVPIK